MSLDYSDSLEIKPVTHEFAHFIPENIFADETEEKQVIWLSSKEAMPIKYMEEHSNENGFN